MHGNIVKYFSIVRMAMKSYTDDLLTMGNITPGLLMFKKMTLPKLPDIGVIRLCTVLGCVLLAGCKQPEQSVAELPAPRANP